MLTHNWLIPTNYGLRTTNTEYALVQDTIGSYRLNIG